MSSLPETADVVVIGAGHNGLVCAAYLAEAGLEVCVLEAREIPGGNTVTEELTLPGFAHDSCSSAHVLIQSNPLLADDELGLLSQYGPAVRDTDPAVVLPQDDGGLLVMHRDLDATVDELGRLVRRRTPGVHRAGRGVERRAGGRARPLELRAAARRRPARRYRACGRQRLGPDPRAVRAPGGPRVMLWLSLATIQDPRRPGTGALPSSIAAGRLRFGWATPIGGSGALPAALIRQLAAHGGSVVTAAPVAAIGVSDGRAVAVTTVDGRRIAARRAVVSGAHLARLAGMLADRPADLLGPATAGARG